MEEHDKGKELTCVPQKSSGKLFVSQDWTPQTLRVIYDLFDNRIADMYLDGEINPDSPTLVSFLEDQD